MAERIRDAQTSLDTTLRRARLVEDRALARTVRELGERLAHINHGLLQLVRLHDIGNEALDRPVEEFSHALLCLIDLLGPVNLVCVEDHVYVNDIRVRFDANHEYGVAMRRMLTRHSVGGITYFKSLTGAQVRTAIGIFASEPAVERPRTALQERFNQAGLSSIQLHPVFRFVADDERVVRGVSEVYEACVEVLAETFSNVHAGRVPNPLPVRRIVNELIDVTRAKDLARIALEIDTSAPAFARHPLMVANLSIMIARAAGLSEASQADLGVAALLHDIGFRSLGPQHPTPFEHHTAAGLRALLRQRGFHEARISRLLVMIEHHHPFARPGGPPSLHARIVHIADDYDALTRHREDGTPAHVPADALRLMAGHTGRVYDPTLLQLFINLMGAYPVGSVLKLGDGTLAVVISGVRSPETFDTPRCKVVRMADGSDPTQELWVDLAKGGRVAAVLGSRLLRIEPERPPPQTQPPKPAPPPPKPTFGSPYLRPPKPPKPGSKNDP